MFLICGFVPFFCHKAQPDIEGIETLGLERWLLRQSRSQSPARHRGHRNPMASVVTIWTSASPSHKAQPDIEGIETVPVLTGPQQREADVTKPSPTSRA